MKKYLRNSVVFAVALAAVAAPVLADKGDELDVEVGILTSTLAFTPFNFGVQALEPFNNSPVPFLPDSGWAGDDPGWLSIGNPKLGEGGLLSPIGAGALIGIEVLSLSGALRAFDPAGGGEITVGQTWLFDGGNVFDAHPIWVIDATSPSFDPNQTVWTGTFRLIDQGTTNYGPSAVHSFEFTVPEPTSLSLLAVAGLALIRRR